MDAGAAVADVVGVYELLEHAGPRQADGEVVIAHGREVQRADDVGARAHAHEGHGAALVVVHVQPGEAVPGVVYARERGDAQIEAAQLADVALHPGVAGVLEQVPVELLVVVPLYELGELTAHEHELLARVGELIAVERAQGGELGVVIAPHLVHHGGLAVHDLVVGEGEDEILGEGVHHREGDAAVVVAAEIGVHGHVVERVVHEAHVPLENETEPPDLGRAGDQRESCGFLGDGDGAGEGAEHGGVHLAQEVHRAEVDVAAVLVGRPLALPAAVVEIEHGADGVYADAVHVVFVEEEHGRGGEEALHLGAGVVEYHGAPVRVLGHAELVALKAGRAVEHAQAVLVAREVRGHPVDNDADALAVELVHEVHKVLRRAVAARGREKARDLIAPGAVVGVLRDGQQLNVGVVHLLAVVGQLVGHAAVVGEDLVLPLAPGAQVHLVYGHGGVYRVPAAAGGHVAAVGPAVALDIPDLGAGRGPGLGVEGKGVGLEDGVPVRADDAVFIDVAVFYVGQEGAPDAVLAPVHGRGIAVPAVEVAYDRDFPRVRGPDHKAVEPAVGYVPASKCVIGPLGVASVVQIDVVIGNIFLYKFSLFHISASCVTTLPEALGSGPVSDLLYNFCFANKSIFSHMAF